MRVRMIHPDAEVFCFRRVRNKIKKYRFFHFNMMLEGKGSSPIPGSGPSRLICTKFGIRITLYTISCFKNLTSFSSADAARVLNEKHHTDVWCSEEAKKGGSR